MADEQELEQEATATPEQEEGIDVSQVDEADLQSYLDDKSNWDKQQNHRLTELGVERDELKETMDRLAASAEQMAASGNGAEAESPYAFDPYAFARQLGFNPEEFADAPNELWKEPVTLGQLFASTDGIAKWGKASVEAVYGGQLPADPAERTSMLALRQQGEEALEKALSTDSTLTNMLTEATIEDLASNKPMADKDELRDAIEAYSESDHGDFDDYITKAAEESHDKWDGKVSERAKKERTRRVKTPSHLRTGSRGGGIPKGEAEPNPWTQEGMAQLARRLRESESYGE